MNCDEQALHSEQKQALKFADLLIKNAQVMLPWGCEELDVACIEGRIVAIGESAWKGRGTIDASGLHLLPGVIDSQVHFRQPGLEHKETIEAGTRGAVLGGVTGVFEMPNTNPLTLTQSDLQQKLTIAENDAWCNYAFYVGGSPKNVHLLEALEQQAGCAGVKIFMGSSFGDLLAEDDEVLERILASGNRRVSIHAEDEARLRQRRALAEQSGDVRDHPNWRDVESAFRATRRIVSIARKTNRPIHILHISTEEELAFLAEHKDIVTVEALPQHLTMVAPDCYEQLGTLAQMNPPIRSLRHRDALWRGINNGLIDVLGSDHAPHTWQEKQLPYPDTPSGMTGVQTLLPVMLNHVNEERTSLSRIVDLLCSGPARVFGMVGKGRIAVGNDADFTIVDLQATRTVRDEDMASMSGWSPYAGVTLTGWPEITIISGKPVMRSGQLIGQPGGRPIVFRNELRNREPSEQTIGGVPGGR
ncbi:MULTISPECIES: dihydroorotase [unclassified Marinobacter]|uniref:dihydroorotase n=1 Tax=unclassified Marinobacter TaxID=83889 RepID=UPI000BF8C7CA|nr:MULTISPECIES: dihydroorotase [unclassified Marinobacter]PFG08518.1 dihydroorotase [Marinobacter sp. LV10MA510-1]PFG54370.1 dihydroorotase [Marinobacter sp. LV10R520-4]